MSLFLALSAALPTLSSYTTDGPMLDCPVTSSAPIWKLKDTALFLLIPSSLGGGNAHMQNFRQVWISHNRWLIKDAARLHNIPAELIAGICWNEIGGDPTAADFAAFNVRTFDHSGPTWTYSLAGKKPESTSFGQVSMQLRTAATAMGLDADTLSHEGYEKLADCLGQDDFNIRLVARHVRQLIEFDKLQPCPPDLTMDEVRIIGARYNRGTRISMQELKRDLNYGERIVMRWDKMRALLSPLFSP